MTAHGRVVLHVLVVHVHVPAPAGRHIACAARRPLSPQMVPAGPCAACPGPVRLHAHRLPLGPQQLHACTPGTTPITMPCALPADHPECMADVRLAQPGGQLTGRRGSRGTPVARALLATYTVSTRCAAALRCCRAARAIAASTSAALAAASIVSLGTHTPSSTWRMRTAGTARLGTPYHAPAPIMVPMAR